MASAGRREGPPGRGRRLRPSTGPSPAAAARIEVDDQPRPVIAALAAEPSCITGALRARDTALMAAALAAMGVDVREEGLAKASDDLPGTIAPAPAAAWRGDTPPRTAGPLRTAYRYDLPDAGRRRRAGRVLHPGRPGTPAHGSWVSTPDTWVAQPGTLRCPEVT
jgi:hypothetical protein